MHVCIVHNIQNIRTAILSDNEHLAITFVNFFREKYLVAVYKYMMVIPALRCVQGKHLRETKAGGRNETCQAKPHLSRTRYDRKQFRLPRKTLKLETLDIDCRLTSWSKKTRWQDRRMQLLACWQQTWCVSNSCVAP